jgi:hypothetical protein
MFFLQKRLPSDKATFSIWPVFILHISKLNFSGQPFLAFKRPLVQHSFSAPKLRTELQREGTVQQSQVTIQQRLLYGK